MKEILKTLGGYFLLGVLLSIFSHTSDWNQPFVLWKFLVSVLSITGIVIVSKKLL